jgi:hypothetical protein
VETTTAPPPNGKQVPPETPSERTDTTLKPIATAPAPAPGTSIKLSIPGAVNLPDLPVVESRPGEDLFRPQKPVDAEHKPSLPVRRPRKPEPPAEPPREPAHAAEPEPAPLDAVEPDPPAPLNADMRAGNGQHTLDVSQLDTDAGQHSLDVSRLAPLDPEVTQQSPELNRPAPLDADTRQHPPVQPPPFAAQAAPGRPALPQRRRQQNLAPQLREEPAPEWPPSRSNPEHNREDTPDQARSRLAAFQAGTRRGRHEQVPDETDTIGSARNGQHRSE